MKSLSAEFVQAFRLSLDLSERAMAQLLCATLDDYLQFESDPVTSDSGVHNHFQDLLVRIAGTEWSLVFFSLLEFDALASVGVVDFTRPKMHEQSLPRAVEES